MPPSSLEKVASFVGDGVVALVSRAVPTLHGAELQKAVARFKEHYRLHCLDNTRAYPGVPEMLFALRHKTLAVITNKPLRISRRILEALGLLSRFQLVLGGDSLRWKKPDPQPVLWAASHLGISAMRRVLMVGDSDNDVRSGRSAGAITCAVFSNIGDHTKLRRSAPDVTLSAIRELLLYVR